MYSTDDDDFSDAEMAAILRNRIYRRTRAIRLRPNHFNDYGDKDFYDRFRMSKTSVKMILELIGFHIKRPTNWNNALSEETMILMCLRLYATGGMLRSIADLYGVCPATVSNVITEVSHYLALLKSRFIHFPTTAAELSKNQREFYDIAKFPRVIGALDCTHIKIISPGGDDAELYRNRKGFHSINVQTVCDASLKIINIVARWPGSAHDSHIFRNSKICAEFEAQKFGDAVIVADSGYPNKKYLMTPVLNPRTAAENLYNESLIRTRCCVERSYGVWKRRFPILSVGVRLNYKKLQAIIVATAVLHNICCINNERDLPRLSQNSSEQIDFVLSVPRNRGIASNNNYSTRNLLINQYFSRLFEASETNELSESN